jgi:hypothetical protein
MKLKMNGFIAAVVFLFCFFCILFSSLGLYYMNEGIIEVTEVNKAILIFVLFTGGIGLITIFIPSDE